ncbi:MAG: hypothetical protein IJ779_04940 [Ruminococcus sp.]|nr:hypothetical protein [Ruminococcus sp.]
MYETKNNDNSLKSFLFRTLTDPVLLYAALILMSIMYHYRSSLTLVYGLVSYVLGWLIFRVFDFVNKHRLLGSVAYIAIGAASLMAIRYYINKGEENYPIIWGLWFLTPQAAVTYNKWYTIAVFILFFIFMMSVIYYFTRVRYRIFMNFLIFIIPFTIYGKEDEKMPTVFILALAAAYVLLMVRFRSLQDTPQSKVVCRHELWKPVAVYTALFAAFTAIVPKPYIEADRSTLESLINADELTDRLDAMLNVFRNTNTAQQYRAKVRNTPVYYALADEALRLKTSTYSHYSFDKDQWTADDPDKLLSAKMTEYPLDLSHPGNILGAYLYAASLDSGFAEKYGLTDFIGVSPSVPPEKEVKLVSVYRSSDFAPVPQFATSMNAVGNNGEVSFTPSGLVYKDGKFDRNARFSFNYSSDRFMYLGSNKKIIDVICKSDYRQMSLDAEKILGSSGSEKAADYLSALTVQDDDFFDYEDIFTEDIGNSRIKALSKELTKDIESDYDKAKVLEGYFYKNDYTYDLDFDTTGKNAEDFLFETKTGVCYEYATAMILLARAAGIPARFCVGYNMTDAVEDTVQGYNYVVNTKDSHGYPELYIKGYGWMSFEPTIADVMGEKDKTTATDLLARAGLMILTATLLVLAIAMLYPRISHRIFMIFSKKKRPAETAEAAMRRICRLYRIDSGCTSQEAAAVTSAKCGADISRLADLFDRAVYGEEELNSDEKEVIMEEYVQAYRLYMENNRIFRRKPAVNS